MNLKEGTRRLALLLGVAGAIAGGVVSYPQLQSLMRQRADHRQFEQLANSGLVQEAKNWITLAPEQRDRALAQMTPEHKSQLGKALGFNGTPKFNPNAPYEPYDEWAQYEVKPPAKKAKTLAPVKPPQYLDDNGNPIDAPSKTYLDDNGNPISGQTTSSKTQSAPGFGPAEDDTPAGFGPAEESADVGEIDKDGIKTIRWTIDHKVQSLETLDGRTIYPTPAPGAWSYVMIAILPLLGFFIPWGIIRAIGWVGAGFKERSK